MSTKCDGCDGRGTYQPLTGPAVRCDRCGGAGEVTDRDELLRQCEARKAWPVHTTLIAGVDPAKTGTDRTVATRIVNVYPDNSWSEKPVVREEEANSVYGGKQDMAKRAAAETLKATVILPPTDDEADRVIEFAESIGLTLLPGQKTFLRSLFVRNGDK